MAFKGEVHAGANETLLLKRSSSRFTLSSTKFDVRDSDFRSNLDFELQVADSDQLRTR